jgi:hypothetical protein
MLTTKVSSIRDDLRKIASGRIRRDSFDEELERRNDPTSSI